MNFIIKILHLMILILMGFKIFGMCSVVPQSPCPDKFLYKYEGNRWFGEIKILVPNRNVNRIILNVTYYIWSDEEANSGELIKKDSDEEAVSNLENGRPITFILNFPLPHQPAFIKKIELNKKLICMGEIQELKSVTEEARINIYEIVKTYAINKNKDSPVSLINHDENNSGRRIYSVTESTDKCGLIPDIKAAINLISYGEPATRQPWLVALFEGWKFFCAGTLISSQFVVTAAHCTHGKTTIQLLLGTTDVSVFNAPGTVIRQSVQIKPHQQYVQGSSNADIAIVKMSEPVEFTSTIQPVCMWPNTYLEEERIRNHQGNVFGWGNDENGLSSTQLKNTALRIRSLWECKQMDLIRDTLSDKTICAASDDFRSGPCRGDSGGGLYLTVLNKTTIRGVISSAVGFENKGTCDHTYFSVFTDVGKHFNWIRDIVNTI